MPEPATHRRQALDRESRRSAVRPRPVAPPRAAYADTALLAVEARRAGQPFIADSSDLTHVAEVLGAHGADGTPEGMYLPRARAAWICARLEGGAL